MVEESSKTLAIELSGQVLRGDTPFDEALLAAQSRKVVSVFISCLNTFAGGEYFDLTEAEARLRSGDAQRALDGRIPLFELPPELQGNVYDTRLEEHIKAEREEIEKELSVLDSRIDQLQTKIQECNEDVDRLEMAGRNRPPGPNPWIGSVIVLVAVFFVCLLVFFSTGSMRTIFGIFLGGTALVGIVLTNDLSKLRKFLKKEQRESWKRLDKIRKNQKHIKNLEAEIVAVRDQGTKVLENVRMIPEETVPEIRSQFRRLFPPGPSK